MIFDSHNKDRILKVVSAYLPYACSRRPDIRDGRNCENAKLRRAATSSPVSASILLSISVPVQLPFAYFTTNNGYSPASTNGRGSRRYFSNLCIQL